MCHGKRSATGDRRSMLALFGQRIVSDWQWFSTVPTEDVICALQYYKIPEMSTVCHGVVYCFPLSTALTIRLSARFRAPQRRTLLRLSVGAPHPCRRIRPGCAGLSARLATYKRMSR